MPSGSDDLYEALEDTPVIGGEADADQALAELAETTYGPSRLCDLRVGELLDRYFTWLDDGSGAAPTERRRRIADTLGLVRRILAATGYRRSVIGVTGATGEVGGRVARRLAEAGHGPRLLVRDASRAPSFAGAEVAQFGGYSDAAGMRIAFRGVSTLLLVSAREAQDRVDQHRTAIDAATESGVERIVYMSFISAAPDATFTFARDHFHTEEHIRASGLAFTVSRQNLYMDLLPVLGGDSGVIRGPAGDGRVAPVARDDVADALLAMLTQVGHDGATYQLTGPESLTLTDIAERVSECCRRAVRYENETIEQAHASRASYGAPAWELEGWISTYTAIAAGEFDVVTDDVARLTGHPPIEVRAFLSDR